MARYRVQITDRAKAQAREISRWWRKNRPSNPGLFREEMAAATARIATMPGTGSLYEPGDTSGMRRVLLPRTSYHIYYIAQDQPRVVTILAVWHTSRGQGPEL